jgi:hypothetical protein
MSRILSSLLIALALAAPALAQQVIIRKARPIAPVELRGGNLAFVLPTATISQSLNGAWLSRSSDQPMELTCAISGTPLLVRHTADATVGEGFSMDRDGAWTRNVGLRNRSALVLQATEKTSLEAAFETQMSLDQMMNSLTSQRAEAVFRTGDVQGLTFSATGGRSLAVDASRTAQEQTYTSLSAEQKLPWMPVRVALAPGMGWQDTLGVDDGDRFLLGGTTSLLLDAAQATTLSVSLAQYDSSSPITGLASRFRSYYTQLEQRLSPATTVHLRMGCEQQWSALAATTAALFLGADSTFSLGESLTGSFQIRQRALQMLGEASALPETVLSFSLGSKF